MRKTGKICEEMVRSCIFTPEVLLERTRYDNSRPLLQVENPLAKLQELYNARDPLYRNTAHIVIESDSCAKTVKRLFEALSR